MSCKYYDDAIAIKLKKWLPSHLPLRVLSSDNSSQIFKLKAEDLNDQELTLPFISLARNSSFNLLSNIKTNKSFDGLKIIGNTSNTAQLNVIPIQIEYQLDIYTKTTEEADELLRNLLFKLINNPQIIIEIPYNDIGIKHTANIRVGSTVSDTSSSPSNHIFAGQFTRWTINLEIQDAFLFSIPYRKNWILDGTPALEIDDNGEITSEPVVVN